MKYQFFALYVVSDNKVSKVKEYVDKYTETIFLQSIKEIDEETYKKLANSEANALTEKPITVNGYVDPKYLKFKNAAAVNLLRSSDIKSRVVEYAEKMYRDYKTMFGHISIFGKKYPHMNE